MGRFKRVRVVSREGRKKTLSEEFVKLKLIPAITNVRNISVVQNDSDTYKVKAYNVESKINMFAENSETGRNLSTRLFAWPQSCN